MSRPNTLTTAVMASGVSAVQLEHELDRAVEAFGVDHEKLLRAACLESDSVPIGELALTTLFGHTIRRLVEARGRIATERLALCLCEQLALVAERDSPWSTS